MGRRGGAAGASGASAAGAAGGCSPPAAHTRSRHPTLSPRTHSRLLHSFRQIAPLIVPSFCFSRHQVCVKGGPDTRVPGRMLPPRSSKMCGVVVPVRLTPLPPSLPSRRIRACILMFAKPITSLVQDTQQNKSEPQRHICW